MGVRLQFAHDIRVRLDNRVRLVDTVGESNVKRECLPRLNLSSVNSLLKDNKHIDVAALGHNLGEYVCNLDCVPLLDFFDRDVVARVFGKIPLGGCDFDFWGKFVQIVFTLLATDNKHEVVNKVVSAYSEA